MCSYYLLCEDSALGKVHRDQFYTTSMNDYAGQDIKRCLRLGQLSIYSNAYHTFTVNLA